MKNKTVCRVTLALASYLFVCSIFSTTTGPAGNAEEGTDADTNQAITITNRGTVTIWEFRCALCDCEWEHDADYKPDGQDYGQNGVYEPCPICGFGQGTRMEVTYVERTKHKETK